ncbi:MAG TPA: NAD(P)H-hydrate epimerase, partial [Chloroflexi bacterium]|nr:NAD(P)H-hydrate epimerase [Chloroflexota bacterium]
NPNGKRVVILAGRGGNGGGGLVCARRLHNWGATIQVITAHPIDQYRGVPANQLQILQSLNLTISPAQFELPDQPVDLIIDAIIGYSLSGSPTGNAAAMINWANEMGVPILSLDVPSGLDTASGKAYQPTIKATATMTLALPKLGFQQEGAAEYLGELYLADISVPRELYAVMGIYTANIFSGKDIIHLTP